MECCLPGENRLWGSTGSQLPFWKFCKVVTVLSLTMIFTVCYIPAWLKFIQILHRCKLLHQPIKQENSVCLLFAYLQNHSSDFNSSSSHTHKHTHTNTHTQEGQCSVEFGIEWILNHKRTLVGGTVSHDLKHKVKMEISVVWLAVVTRCIEKETKSVKVKWVWMSPKKPFLQQKSHSHVSFQV